MDFEERVRRRNEFDASLVYGTRTFNLMTNRQNHFDYRDNNDNQWTDSQTGVISRQFSRNRQCPLCGTSNYVTVFVKNGFPHVRCRNCDMFYVEPILNEAEYMKHYEGEDSWESVLETEPQRKMQALEANYCIDILSQYLSVKTRASICDIGCGPGTTLGEAKKRGFQVFGIEPNRRSHAVLKSNGIEYLSDFFPLEGKLRDKFDCVLIFNTLEHLVDPMGALSEIRSLLLPGGLIYVSVPNLNALVNRVLHEAAGVFGGHSHIQLFTVDTLAGALKNAGFEILEYETIITELGVIRNYLEFEHPYLGEAKTSFEFLSPDNIYRDHLARNINMIGRSR